MSDSLHPGIDPACEKCKGEGYVVVRDGEVAGARACVCVRECPICRGDGWAPSDPKDPRSARVRCTCRRLSARVARYNAIGIPGRHAASTIRSFAPYEKGLIKIRKRVGEYVEGWRRDEDNRGLVLYGDVGRGKTHLIVAIARELVFRYGCTARFVEFSHLVADLKGGFDRKEGPAARMEELVAADLLIIDELGKGRNTEWEGTVLDELVSRRYNAVRPILATTNFPPTPPSGRATGDLTTGELPSLVDRVGPRVFSRLRETTDFVSVVGEDFRARLAGDAAPRPR